MPEELNNIEVVEEKPKRGRKKASTVTRFYFKNARNRTIRTRVGYVNDKEPGRVIQITAVNNIVALDALKPDEKVILDKLMADPGNEANGGTEFAEVSELNLSESEPANVIDKLIDMDINSLISMLGGFAELHLMSRGQLIARYMKLNDE